MNVLRPSIISPIFAADREQKSQVSGGRTPYPSSKSPIPSPSCRPRIYHLDQKVQHSSQQFLWSWTPSTSTDGANQHPHGWDETPRYETLRQDMLRPPAPAPHQPMARQQTSSPSAQGDRRSDRNHQRLSCHGRSTPGTVRSWRTGPVLMCGNRSLWRKCCLAHQRLFVALPGYTSATVTRSAHFAQKIQAQCWSMCVR